MNEVKTAAGITTGLPMSRYLALEGASASRLRLLRQSPAHCRYALDHPREDTPSLLLGRAAHAAILEPDTFEDLYVRGIEGDGRTRAVKEAREALALDYPHHTILSPADYDAALAMRDSAWKHGAARALLAERGIVEVTLQWEEEGEDGPVACIGRPDKVSDSGLLIDLKTTRDASPNGTFPRDLYTYGYVMQGVHYETGLTHLGREIRASMIIAVESSAPYAVAVYRPDLQSRVAAEEERSALLRVWERCIRSGEWPAYPDTIQPIGLPVWAQRQIEERAAA